MRRDGLVMLVLAGCLAGCKAGTGAGEAAKPAPLDPATLGGVSGVVTFAGKAPAPVKIDTTMDPACGFGGGDVFSEQYAVKDGRLGNVYVAVKSMQPADGRGLIMESGSAGPSVVLDQKGCVYTPHVIALEAGGFVEFRNEDPTMHNVHTMPTVAGNTAVDISEGPKGKPQMRQFKQPEAMIPVRCNNHPWMEAFLNVSATPWFAVTGPDGSFSLKGMPAGTYVLEAVHEKLGEQDVTVVVKPQSEATAAFAFAMK